MIKLLLFLNLFLLEPVVIDIKVRGMVCSFCAQGIEKNISKLKMVENVDVNLKKGFVSIMVKDGESIDMNEIEQIIKDAAYKVLKWLGVNNEKRNKILDCIIYCFRYSDK